MHSFSPQLIGEIILVFREEDGIDISPEEAEQYLQRLGGLFLAFAPKSFRDRVRLCQYSGQTAPVRTAGAFRDLMFN